MTETAPHPASERGSRCDAFIGALVAIGLIALAIRLVTALSSPEPAFISDPTFFRLQGMLLATGHGFADPFVWSSQRRLVATAFHPPLFSTFLGGIYRMGFHSVAAARVGSCLLGTATVVFVGLTGREVSGRRVGLVAASIAALTPNLWVPDGALTSEGLATTFVAATLWLAYRFLRNPRRGTAIWLGISIGLAGLTRPETLALAAIVVVPITVHLALPIRRRLCLVAIAFLAMLIVIAPWTIRSATLFERPVLISTNGQAVIGYANCPSTYEGRSLGSWLITCPGENAGLGVVRSSVHADESVIAFERAQEGLRFLNRHTGRFLTTVLWARIGRTWSAFHPFAVKESAANEGKTRNEMVVGVLALWASLALGVVGVVALARRKTVPIWPLLAPCAIATVISVLAYGTPRFRVIAEPSIAILAAVGVTAILGRLIRSREDLRSSAR